MIHQNDAASDAERVLHTYSAAMLSRRSTSSVKDQTSELHMKLHCEKQSVVRDAILFPPILLIRNGGREVASLHSSIAIFAMKGGMTCHVILSQAAARTNNKNNRGHLEVAVRLFELCISSDPAQRYCISSGSTQRKCISSGSAQCSCNPNRMSHYY